MAGVRREMGAARRWYEVDFPGVRALAAYMKVSADPRAARARGRCGRATPSLPSLLYGASAAESLSLMPSMS